MANCSPTAVPPAPTPAAAGGVTCPECGLVLQGPALRCPRCLAALPLGCDGDCRHCAAKGG